MKRDCFFEEISCREIRRPAGCRNLAHEICRVAAGSALNYHQESQKILSKGTEQIMVREPKIEFREIAPPESVENRDSVAKLLVRRIIPDMEKIDRVDDRK